MFDTILQIPADSVSFYPKKDIIVQHSDSFGVDFSSFEYIPTDSARFFFHIDSNALTVAQKHLISGFSGIQMPFSPTIQSVFFLFFVLCFVILAFWFNKEGPTLVANFKNIFSGGIRNRTVFKEQITASGIWSELFLVLQTILISTIVVFTFSWEKGVSAFSLQNMAFFFVAIFLGISSFIIIKYLVYRVIGYVFAEWGMNEWTEKYFRLVELTGLLIFIPSLFFVFAPEHAEIVFYSLIIVIFIIALVVFWNLLNIFTKNKIGLFNYFLYLCAIEIAPVFLIYKGVFLVINIADN